MYYTLTIYYYRSHFGSRTCIFLHPPYRFLQLKSIMNDYEQVMFNYFMGMYSNEVGHIASYFISIGCNNNLPGRHCRICWPYYPYSNVRISCRKIDEFMRSNEQELSVNSHITGNVSAILRKRRNLDSVLIIFTECQHSSLDDGAKIYKLPISDMPLQIGNIFDTSQEILMVEIEEFDQEIINIVREYRQQPINDDDAETVEGNDDDDNDNDSKASTEASSSSSWSFLSTDAQ